MSMVSLASPLDSLTIEFTLETRVAASLHHTFDALLDELGPHNVGMGDVPMPMVLEPRPGGRWFRDLGDDNGHCWGTVQAIRRPTLLEISGPLMMSFAVSSNVQYRLKLDGDETVMSFRHSALGLFPEGFRDHLTSGWTAIAERVQRRVASAR
jgi:hypothetical protein